MFSFFGLLRVVVGGSRRARRSVRAADGTLNAPPINSGQMPAEVLWVLDGDTVNVRMGGRAVRIRLYAIDCPEDGQPWGVTAKAGLIKMIARKPVVLDVHGIDKYGRTLATIFAHYGPGSKLINVNERMVMLGHAWVMPACTQLSEDRRRQLYRLEAWARSKQVGLWKTPNPIAPWNWRLNGNANEVRPEIEPPANPS
jgi:micrococcal nuclease